MGVTAAGAFLWDRGEHATVDQALVTGAIEAITLAVSFLLLGPTLGLLVAEQERRTIGSAAQPVPVTNRPPCQRARLSLSYSASSCRCRRV